MVEETRGKDMFCSVLFVDMVGYSKRSNAEQIKLKQKFVAAWEEAIGTLPREDVMIIDSGDGAALTALKDSTDTLRVAKSLLAILRKEKASNPDTLFQMRLGIQFGPVELSTNVHGKACIVGDAINSASRVMSFAQPNQLLVSRTYYEMISPLLQEGEKNFHSYGTHHDKHGRPHELYEYVEPGSKPTIPPATAEMKPDLTKPDPTKPASTEPEPAPPAHASTDNGSSLPSAVITVATRPFRWVWTTFMSLVTLGIVILFMYEMIVLVPILNKPDALHAELDRQAQTVKSLFRFGRKAIESHSPSPGGAKKSPPAELPPP